MILLWGLLEDNPLAAVARCLERLRVPIAFINQRDVLDYSFIWQREDALSGRITGRNDSFHTEEVSALYLRPYNFENLDTMTGVERGSVPWVHAAEFEDSMLGWSEVADARVVNRPSAMGSNHSKPFQLDIIRQIGLLVPDTLITTDPDCVLTFRDKHQQIIYKSISSCRSVVSRLDDSALAHLADVTCCPTQFQQYIAGTDYRVHVLEDTVFTCQIVSSGDDYRYAEGASIKRSTLPAEVRQKCIQLTQTLGLAFSGIDLRYSNDGGWYCFEVNPSPGYSFFETEADEISFPLAKFLAAARSLSRS